MNNISVAQSAIDNWFKNEANVSKFAEGMSLVIASGVFPLLQRLGIPNVPAQGSNVQMMAHQASWSNGYQTSLEHLRYFMEIFMPAEKETSLGTPDFGGMLDALARGDLRKEDLDKNELI